MRTVAHHEKFNARAVRKRSDYQSDYERPEAVLLPGEKEQTPTGFISRGYKGNNFEIVYQAIAASSSTARYYHAKKDRVFRVLGGTGMIHLETEKPIKLAVGLEICVPAGTKHHITANTDVYLMIIQAAKYDAHVETDDSTLTGAESTEMLNMQAATVTYSRGYSRAAEQAQELAAQRVSQNPDVSTTIGSSKGFSTAPQPGYGEDLDGEAG